MSDPIERSRRHKLIDILTIALRVSAWATQPDSVGKLTCACIKLSFAVLIVQSLLTVWRIAHTPAVLHPLSIYSGGYQHD